MALDEDMVGHGRFLLQPCQAEISALPAASKAFGAVDDAVLQRAGLAEQVFGEEAAERDAARCDRRASAPRAR